jgi:co-chaperonin GroES (HSP10)
MITYEPVHDGLLLTFVEKSWSDIKKETAKVIKAGKGIYTLEGNLISNRFKSGDIVMVCRRDCVQIDSDHYTIRERDIV